MQKSGNVSKLDAANSFLAAITPAFTGTGQLFTLVDSWYMKWPYLREARKPGFHTTGLVRRDTTLYTMPAQSAAKDRPRGYSEKYTPDHLTISTFIYEKVNETFIKILHSYVMSSYLHE